MEDRDFIPYQEALRLEELGFDEYCMECCYYEWKDREVTHILLHTPDSYDSHSGVKAPTYSQAFRWFREKHNLFGQVNIHTYFIYNISNGDFKMVKKYDKLFETYEETELACLKKLIEIVKENENKIS